MVDAQKQAAEYELSLGDLTTNNKTKIGHLTALAENNMDIAPLIVQSIRKHLEKVSSELKLPVLYLVDSILRNVGKAYTALLTQSLVSMFSAAFEKMNEATRGKMFELRRRWCDVLPATKLHELDVRVATIDPAWPVFAVPPSRTAVHLDPVSSVSKAPPSAQGTEEAKTRHATLGSAPKAATSREETHADEIAFLHQKELMLAFEARVKSEMSLPGPSATSTPSQEAGQAQLNGVLPDYFTDNPARAIENISLALQAEAAKITPAKSVPAGNAATSLEKLIHLRTRQRLLMEEAEQIAQPARALQISQLGVPSIVRSTSFPGPSTATVTKSVIKPAPGLEAKARARTLSPVPRFADSIAVAKSFWLSPKAEEFKSWRAKLVAAKNLAASWEEKNGSLLTALRDNSLLKPARLLAQPLPTPVPVGASPAMSLPGPSATYVPVIQSVIQPVPSQEALKVKASAFLPASPATDSAASVEPQESAEMIPPFSAAHLASISSAVSSEVVVEEKLTRALKYCLRIVNKLLLKKWARPFRKPVAVLWPDLKNYHKVIEEPMDLSTIKKKLESFEYKNSKEFAADFKLIVSNCLQYNGPHHEIYKMASKMELNFYKRFAKCPPDPQEHFDVQIDDDSDVSTDSECAGEEKEIPVICLDDDTNSSRIDNKRKAPVVELDFKRSKSKEEEDIQIEYISEGLKERERESAKEKELQKQIQLLIAQNQLQKEELEKRIQDENLEKQRLARENEWIVEKLTHEKMAAEQRFKDRIRATLAEKEAALKETAALEKRLESFGDVIETELQCSICNELYVKAVTINCNHTFCSYCLNNWKKIKNECPECRAYIRNENRAFNLDSLIEKMVEKLSNDRRESRRTLIAARNETKVCQGPAKSLFFRLLEEF